jgi:predicted ArsR family transcriptional regulator
VVGRTEDIGRVALLHEPARRRLYEYIRERRAAVGRDEAASAVGISRGLAAFHLDRLVEGGLLTAEFRRLSGRTGPGAGRPAKLYRVSEARVHVSFPETRYEVAGSVLVRSLAASSLGPGGQEVVRGPAEARGRELGRELSRVVGGGSDLVRADRALAELGFHPERTGGLVRLHNCPFDALVEENAGLICALNESLLRGLLEGLGCRGVTAEIDPEPAGCCVRLRVGPREAGEAGRPKPRAARSSP